MLGLIVFVVIGIVAWRLYKSYKHDQWVKGETDKAVAIDKKRGDDIRLRISLGGIPRRDLSKIGYPTDYAGLIFLSSVSDGTVHFAIPGSPALHLNSVEFQAQYSQQTTGTVSGRSGSAAVGGLLFGGSGAAAGAARKRNVNTTTKNVEQAAPGLLTFVESAGGTPFVIQIAMTTAVYDALVKDFVWKEPVTQTTVSQDDLSALEQLGKLRDSGILTDAEFSAKKAQILAKP